jgi:hypothetical protein
MSTRATYSFAKHFTRSGPNYPVLTLYIHHDGYPTGAAYYFWQAHHFAGNTHGGFTEAFIRANGRAELTDSHQHHGDTEYRYTCVNGVLTAQQRVTDGWRTFFEGPYWEFINRYPASIDGFTPIREMAGLWGTRCLVSRQQAESNAKRAREHATQYRAKFPQFTGNADSADQDAERLEQLLADYDAMTAFEAHPVPAMVQQ